MTTSSPAAASGIVTLAPESADPIEVVRMGFGAMRITGKGIWGAPTDHDNAVAVLRSAVELGVNFIDTADSYGPYVSEDLIREALHPYNDVLIATKGGLTRQGPDQWFPVGNPAYLRQCVEMSLRRLGVERIDLWQLHRIDPTVPMEDQAGVIKEMVVEGKIRHVGLSEVDVEAIEAFAAIVPVVSVQNLYNVTNRASEAVVDHCTATGRVVIPWFPIGAGPLAAPGGPLEQIAAEAGITGAQAALAWLLQRSPVMAPIPGTSSVAHLEENVAASGVTLSAQTVAALDALGV
jgi:aryl-alcohol dehydrogenase-like predicted oxidoreductase